MRKHLVLLMLTVLVYSWFFVTYQKVPTTLQVLGANTNISLYVQPDAGREPIVESIDEAKSEVLVEVYLLSDAEIITALEDAKSRGVNVEVMLEQHPFGGGNVNASSKPKLESPGIEVRWTNPAYTLTHEKAIIIDGTAVWVLNQNLTTAAFDKNREYNVLDNNPIDVQTARAMFLSDWDRKNFTPPANTHLIVSPVTARPAITSLIQSASKSLDIEAEVMTDEAMILLLSTVAKTMPVRIIVPTLKQISANAKALTALTSAGAAIKTLSSPYIHAKMILADETKAYVGSINLTSQSLDENRELGIILTEDESLEMLLSTFNSDWEAGVCYNTCTDSNL